MEYKSKNPYPEIRVERQNMEYAALLLDDFAGSVSEDTAIHLYLYQSLVNDNKYKEFNDIMLQIAEVEMHHLSLLGQTITKLGGTPLYASVGKDNIPRFWNAGNVNYANNLKNMLEIDIASETQAIRNYQYQITIIKDQYIKKLLERIIEDEMIHLGIFKNLYLNYFGGGSNNR